jgi:hypothetical protein
MDQTAQGQAPTIPVQGVVVQQQPINLPVPPPQTQPIAAVGEVAQAASLVPPMVTQSSYIGLPKEQLVVPMAPEKVPLVELRESEKIPEEVESWMEKLEQAGEIKIPEAIKKDEQVILDNATPTVVKDVVVLPLSQQGAVVAAKKTVTDSARWLYEWCTRLAKMLGDRAKYKV